MSKRESLLSSKIKLSLTSSIKVFKKPSYALLAIFGSLLTVAVVLWAFNLDVLSYLIFKAPIGPGEKLGLFADIYKDIYTNFSEFHEVVTVAFTLLFGVNIALMTFIIKNKGFRSIPKKSGLGGLVLAIVGGGCMACGTSLIAPLLASVSGASSVFFRDISLILNLLATVLVIYSIYRLGLIASNVHAKMHKNVDK